MHTHTKHSIELGLYKPFFLSSFAKCSLKCIAVHIPYNVNGRLSNKITVAMQPFDLSP